MELSLSSIPTKTDKVDEKHVFHAVGNMWNTECKANMASLRPHSQT